jgi:osmotically-inducible protein OsmY
MSSITITKFSITSLAAIGLFLITLGTSQAQVKGTNTPSTISGSGAGVDSIDQASNRVPAPEAEQIKVLPRLTVFERNRTANASTVEMVRAKVLKTLSRASNLPSKFMVRVGVEGNTLVLRGMVRDEHEYRLVEAVARLTPGVNSLRNELAVWEEIDRTGQ